MARFILSTLEALTAGDLSADDAAYSLAAHILSTARPKADLSASESSMKTYVARICHAVGSGYLSTLTASRYLITAREKLSTGESLDQIFRSAEAYRDA